MYGGLQLAEAVRQLQGEGGDRQVRISRNARGNPENALVNGTGGPASSTGTVVLATG